MAIDVSTVSSVLWEVGQDYGLKLKVTDQVAVARDLAKHQPIRAQSVRDAFVLFEIAAPPRGYAQAVAIRINQLDKP